jgi:hypothetical protein
MKVFYFFLNSTFKADVLNLSKNLTLSHYNYGGHRQGYKEKMPHFGTLETKQSVDRCFKNIWEVNGLNLGRMPVYRMVGEIFAVS